MKYDAILARELAEQKRMQSEAHHSLGLMAYFAYVEVTSAEQRSYAPFMPARVSRKWPSAF